MFFFGVLIKITPAKDGKPVNIELIDAKTKELKDTLEVTHIFCYCLYWKTDDAQMGKLLYIVFPNTHRLWG